jgi:hypothetical protein
LDPLQAFLDTFNIPLKPLLENVLKSKGGKSKVCEPIFGPTKGKAGDVKRGSPFTPFLADDAGVFAAGADSVVKGTNEV